MNTPLRVVPLALLCLLVMLGCRSKPAAPGSLIPTAAPTSAALPGSNDAADAPNAPAVVQSASGSLTTYSDSAAGVSFHYPSTWRPWHAGSAMYAPLLAQNSSSVKITQTFDPGGTTFAKTNLVGLSFSYAVRPQSASKECAQLPQTIMPGGRQAPQEIINGLSFTRYEAGDAGMCHQMSVVFNSIARDGACFLFERDLETICSEIRGPGNPIALTPTQSAHLQSELDRVMQTVVLR